MEQLWAPWRQAYVSAEKSVGTGHCFLCQGLAEKDDRKNLIVWRTPRSVVVLNRFPYNNGHLLVAPLVHGGRLDELNAEDHADLMLTLQKMVAILEGLMQPQGFNIGLNLGQAAGAGLPGHLHWHLVPRWSGDTNFMPVLADTRVIVQALDALYDLLTERLKAGAS
jgi:ATP adenylyltransferase